MDKYINYILQDPVMAAYGAALAMFLAGIIFRRSKIISIIIILAAGFVLYIVLNNQKIEKVNIDNIKKNVKEKVMENI